MVERRNWQDAHFVVEDTINDAGSTSSDAVIGGFFLFDNGVGFVFSEVGDVAAGFGGKKLGDFLAANISEGPKGNFGIAMFADDVGVNGLRINIEIVGDTGAESGGIEDGAGADDFFGGEAGKN